MKTKKKQNIRINKSLDNKVEILVLGTVFFNRIINYKEYIHWEIVKFTDDDKILSIFINIPKFLRVLKDQADNKKYIGRAKGCISGQKSDRLYWQV